MSELIAKIVLSIICYNVIASLVVVSGFWLTAGLFWMCLMFSHIYVEA